MNYPSRPCPVCHSQTKEILYEQKYSALTGQTQLSGYNVALCGDCGAAYADDIPDQDWFNGYYREISKYTHDQRGGEEPASDKTRFRDIADLIAKHLPDKQSHILDCGCATGGLLRCLKDSGYSRIMGMDPSPSSAEIASRIHGIRVVNSSLTQIAREEEPFDLLIQVGVLEHICDVKNALAMIRSTIVEGGLVYIEVPDVVGFKDWPGAPFQQFSIEHINFFSRSSLIGLMERNGFEAVEVLCTARDHTADTKMPVVCGFFRKNNLAAVVPKVDIETEPSLRQYIEQSARAEERIRRTISELVVSQEPILVWGVGTHTLHLMQTTEFDALNIVAFVDSNTNYQTRELHGKLVLPPDALGSYPQPILISSQVFQSEIENQIRRDLKLPNKTFTIYEA